MAEFEVGGLALALRASAPLGFLASQLNLTSTRFQALNLTELQKEPNVIHGTHTRQLVSCLDGKWMTAWLPLKMEHSIARS